MARASWLVLGVALLLKAQWPPSCTPQGLWDVAGAYDCSMRLADQRGWIEAALLTWLWATPILVGMAVLRWLHR